jgi:PAS domain S-box-containing protein
MGVGGTTANISFGADTLDALADGVVTLDRAGTITSWNRAAAALLGYPSHEIIGGTLAPVIPAQFRPLHMAGFHAAIDSGALKHGGRPVRVQATTAGGEVIPLAMTLGLLKGTDGTTLGAVAVLRPTTELEIFA